MYFEGVDPSFSFELLRGYLASRMMWDPFMSEEEFEEYLDEFLMIYYGEGWEYIKEYLYIQNRAGDLKGCWTNNFDWPWDVYDKEYYGSMFDRICELFEAASSATDDPEKKERIELLSIHAKVLGLSATYETDYLNGTAQKAQVYKERYSKLLDYMYKKAYREEVRDDAFRAFIGNSGPGGFDNLPKDADDVRDTMTWLFTKDDAGNDYTGKR